ncbi:hypothetical protein B484DRAFT_458798 [Ochromonadaceae sp. CCMP2298]|nr:hypothetical protein B484DRAFT_458798 [Ochromonadaceae sp. CCMP2298]
MSEALHDTGVEELLTPLAGLRVADPVGDIGLVLDVDDHAIGVTEAQIVEHFGNGLSKSALIRLYRDNGMFECMKCPEVCDARRELIRHLRKEKHFYPKDGLDEFKSALAEKVSARITASSGTARVYQFLDLAAMFAEVGADTPNLSMSEKSQYARIFKMVLQLIRCR